MEPIPLQETTADERSMACLAHVLQLVGWIIAPLIIFILRRGSKFVSFHALQALLLQICYMAMAMVCILGFVVVMIVTVATSSGPHQQPPIALFLLFPLMWGGMMILWVTTLVAAIVYGMKANRGEWAQYPVIGGWARRILHV